MNKVQKIREEVARIQLYTQSEVLKQVLDYIDEVQKEPVSEDLEETTNNYVLNVRKGYPRVMDETDRYICNAFKTGAKWQKEQMEAKAIDGYVIEDIEEGNGDFLLSAEYLPKSMGLKDRQKVKVILIKGEEI